MVEGLDVAMPGAGEGGRGGRGIRYVVKCCCGGEMYCSAWRLAPRISCIMSFRRLIILLTGAMLLETTYRRKCHIIGYLSPAVTGINVFLYTLLQIKFRLRNRFKFISFTEFFLNFTSLCANSADGNLIGFCYFFPENQVRHFGALMTNLKPCRQKMIVFACADNEGLDQHPSAYPRDLIRLYSAVSNTNIAKILKKKKKKKKKKSSLQGK